MKSREAGEAGDPRAPGAVAGASLIARLRPTVISSMYVAAVAVLAGVGFIGHTPWPILLAALVTAPASILALPVYYLVYGLLAMVPGANPSFSSGSETAGADGSTSTSSVTDSVESWFPATTHLLGILTFVVAAIVNVAFVRGYIIRRDS